MDRKQFLITSSLAAFSLSAFGRVSLDEQNQFTGDCETTDDILGPFYRPKAPMSKNLLFEGLKGNRIFIKGKVYTDDCETVLEDALVEIWHCNTEGEYDNESSKMLHRARWVTDKKGSYSFKTIIPGKYLNGGLFRPSHIHFRVTCEGHKELISQIYFAGDPHITKDPWASQKKAEHRILPINPVNTVGGLEIGFDIFLRKK
ncbi:MAG: catechol 1,2-dioxygenase [Arenicella sp.]|jgi:catechol 1,2-dioxygenase